MLKHVVAGLAAALAIGLASTASADMFESDNAPGMCLNVVVGGSSLQPCNGGIAQDFAVQEDPATGNTYILQGFNCVMVAGQNQMLKLTSCTGGNPPPSTQFSFDGGVVQADGLCLDVKGGGRNAGTKVIGFACNGQRNQSWTIRATGATVGSGIGARFDSATEARLSANHAPSMCIGAGPGGQAELQPCSSAPVMFFLSGGAPTYIAFSDVASQALRCLASQGSQNQTLRFEPCDASTLGAHLNWGLTTNGLLRNEQGLCADVKGGGKAPGTPLIFFNCSGNPNQRFTPIQ